jgi:hypothetical protein
MAGTKRRYLMNCSQCRIQWHLVVLGLCLLRVPLSAEDNLPEQNKLSASSAVIRIPAMANNPGLFGAFFRTKVSILNVTTQVFQIEATLFNQNGEVQKVALAIGPGQALNFDNFLEQVFGYQGAGAVKLASLPSGQTSNQFMVSAEVYADSLSGRYKTIVQPGGDLDSISSSREAFTPGISVDATSRTNIGCYNDGFQALSPQTIFAELYRASGTLVNTYALNLPEKGWSQIGINDTVSGGYIKWRPQTQSSCYCYAVVVDNNSNDGTFIPALSYIP